MAIIQSAEDSTTLVLNGTAITDFISGDIITLTSVNPATTQINSSTGGVNIIERIDRDVYDLVIRVQRLSDSDIFLNNILRQSPPSIINGSLKENYTSDGVDRSESWLLENGSFTGQPSKTINNEDGNAVSEYTIRFRSATRSF